MEERGNFHESFEHEEPVYSARGFATCVAAILTAIGIYYWWYGRGNFLLWWFTAVMIYEIGVHCPIAVKPFIRIWLVVTRMAWAAAGPLLMSAFYFGVLMPLGMLMRFMGADPLRLRRNRKAKSYWIQRDPPGPDPDSLRGQF